MSCMEVWVPNVFPEHVCIIFLQKEQKVQQKTIQLSLMAGEN